MGPWSQYDSDSSRLPTGFTRVAYDADSGCYTFRDSSGKLWRGNPGEQYGVMHRVVARPSDRRLFADDPPRPKPQGKTSSAPKTFYDIVQASQIASASQTRSRDLPAYPARNARPFHAYTHSRDSSSTSTSSSSSGRNAQTSPNAFSKMQSLVQTAMRRSATFARRPVHDQERARLIPSRANTFSSMASASPRGSQAPSRCPSSASSNISRFR
ncbi:hypothetical protein PLICRDRAFT_49022 [Plicaturopsis crispa FD-325 SS-3]|nr:hypothetical protein PLICRDRAFT_49022 [Plicaturopsis crispa FD-325 SS-3]